MDLLGKGRGTATDYNPEGFDRGLIVRKSAAPYPAAATKLSSPAHDESPAGRPVPSSGGLRHCFQQAAASVSDCRPPGIFISLGGSYPAFGNPDSAMDRVRHRTLRVSTDEERRGAWAAPRKVGQPWLNPGSSKIPHGRGRTLLSAAHAGPLAAVDAGSLIDDGRHWVDGKDPLAAAGGHWPSLVAMSQQLGSSRGSQSNYASIPFRMPTSCFYSISLAGQQQSWFPGAIIPFCWQPFTSESCDGGYQVRRRSPPDCIDRDTCCSESYTIVSIWSFGSLSFRPNQL